MKRYLNTLTIIFILITAIPFFAQPVLSPWERPNIVIIVSDDHAYQAISAYGSKLMQTKAYCLKSPTSQIPFVDPVVR